MPKKKLIIVGSGPAGYTAAIYAARADLAPLLYEGFPSGGQLMTTTDVENYPGFPNGIMGPELIDAFRKQALRFGAEILTENVEAIDLSQHPFLVGPYEAEAVILATGAYARRLDVPGAGDKEFWQKGVTACAVCDGASPIFRGKPLFVIGGGDTAVEDALFLTKFASKVYVVHRRAALRASKIMVDRLVRHAKVEILYNHILVRVEGDQVVCSVTIKNLASGEEEKKEAGGVFFAVGHEPNTGFLKGQLALHENGYIKVAPGTTKTSVAGVFAAGDVQDYHYRQAVTAAGTGCMAALEAERWLVAQGY